VEQNRKVLEVLVIEKEAQVKELKLQIAEAAAQSSIANKLTYIVDPHFETVVTG
jgi:riboflavin synthase